MNIILCVDKNNGLLFFGKRLSLDCVLREKILEISSGGKLWVNSYTADQFEDKSALCIDENPLSCAGENDFCFVENIPVDITDAKKIYLFNWNRDYPADVFFDVDLQAEGFKKTGSDKFEGNSHKKITLEIFER